MGKNPAFQFYPKDWLTDFELRSCSLGAQGLWINLLCLMHFSQKYGFLLINGAQPEPKVIAKVLNLRPKSVHKRLQELIQKGVARIDENGIIYSKRMIEDQRLREIRREAGKQGGNPLLLNQMDNQDLNHGAYPACTPPPSSSSFPSPSPSPKKEQEEAPPRFLKKLITDEHEELIARVLKGFPDVFKFLQRAVNNDCLWEDVIETIASYEKQMNEIDEAWAWCEAVLKAKTQKRKTMDREESWQKQKIQEAEDVKRWLAGFGKH